jgi:hypothetical protein
MQRLYAMFGEMSVSPLLLTPVLVIFSLRHGHPAAWVLEEPERSFILSFNVRSALFPFRWVLICAFRHFRLYSDQHLYGLWNTRTRGEFRSISIRRYSWQRSDKTLQSKKRLYLSLPRNFKGYSPTQFALLCPILDVRYTMAQGKLQFKHKHISVEVVYWQKLSRSHVIS